MAASTAPAPRPSGTASSSSSAKSGTAAKPSSANPVMKPLVMTTPPALKRLSTAPLAKPDSAEQAVATMVIRPAASIGCRNESRMAGQATPKTPSGRPRLMKAR